MKQTITICSLLLIATFAYSQNVGIGTTTPAFKLDVNGNLNIKGDSSLYIYNKRIVNIRGGMNNTFLGDGSGGSITTGTDNTANGEASLSFNTTGSWNTATGSASLLGNTIGNYNAAFGLQALFSNAAGSYATAIGTRAMALCNSTTVSFINGNVAVGFEALLGSVNSANNTGNNNTAIGFRTLSTNSTGSGNTATGRNALFSNTTGSSNTASGGGALFANTIGSSNTACGSGALTSTTGSYNTANGLGALDFNIGGSYNTATGTGALNFNAGNNNTGVGYSANSYSIYSNGNTALGYAAGDNYDNGNNNTFIGYNAYANAASYTNSTLLGYNTSMSASNQVRIGNSSVTSIGGQVGWTTISDARVKKNIQSNVPGLDFILKLNPVTYNIDVAAADKLLRPDAPKLHEGQQIPVVTQEELDAKAAKSKIVYTGFIAQDVETIAKSVGYDFSGVDAPKNEKDLYGIRYAEFVVPMVKAMQEQQKMIEDLQKKVQTLEQTVAQLQK